MKKIVTISLIIFLALVAYVLIAGLVSDKGAAKDVSPLKSTVPALNVILSKVELAKHNSAQSCWLLISGKVYDVTSFIYQHPGGAGEILPACGTDATAAYDTRDNTGTHSSSARAMLADYYIGDLGQGASGTPNKK